MNKSELKNLLINIKNANYELPSTMKPYDISLCMLENIGDSDSEFRDNLILSTFFKWIGNDILSDDEVYNILMMASDDKHLLNGLGSTDDRVFCRTFSAEVVAAIIYRHRNNKFICEEDVFKVFENVLEFYKRDHDVRGYVEGKGWAHGAAHGADALDEFARCQELKYDDLKKILDAIYNKINISHYGYIHFEDERIITALKGILERKIIPLDEIDQWIKSFGIFKRDDHSSENLVLEFNRNMFLKSLYFRLIKEVEYKKITDTIMETLISINRFAN